jgi:hypothetical protein
MMELVKTGRIQIRRRMSIVDSLNDDVIGGASLGLFPVWGSL